MCAKLVDPRITMDGKRILIDGILLRTWLKNLNIGMTTFYRCYKKDMSVTDIENKYKNHKRAPAKEHFIQYKDKEWTIPELHRSGLCSKDVSENALRNRILTHHWDIGRALSEPPRRKCGYEVTYKGKVYASITDLCLKLGISPVYVISWTTSGVDLEVAIERAYNTRVVMVEYKGKQMRMVDLVEHPDNIHKLPYRVIYTRINNLSYTPEDALRYPSSSIARNTFVYKGKHYNNKLDFCRSNNLDNVSYSKLMGLDPDTPEFFEVIDELTSTK